MQEVGPCGSVPNGILGCGCLPWYVVQSTPGKAHQTFSRLSARFKSHFPQIVVYRPLSRRGAPVYINGKRATREAIEPLFPGYLFVSFTDADPWGEIVRSEGVVRLFSRQVAGAWVPTRLPLGLVESLQARGRAGDGVIDERKPAFAPIAEKAVGRVLDGPFAGFDAVFKMRVGADRIRVLATIFGRSTEVELDRADFQVVG